MSIFADQIQDPGPEKNVNEFDKEHKHGVRNTTGKGTDVITVLVTEVLDKKNE